MFIPVSGGRSSLPKRSPGDELKSAYQYEDAKQFQKLLSVPLAWVGRASWMYVNLTIWVMWFGGNINRKISNLDMMAAGSRVNGTRCSPKTALTHHSLGCRGPFRNFSPSVSHQFIPLCCSRSSFWPFSVEHEMFPNSEMLWLYCWWLLELAV
jgi:hypothetical protein